MVAGNVRITKARLPGHDLPQPQRRILYLVGTYHLLNDAAVVSLAPLLPLLREDIVELEEYGAVGLLMGLGLAVTAVGQFLVGRRADRQDPRWLLAGGLGLLGLSLLLLTQAQTFLQVLLIVVLLRVGGSFYHPVGLSWLGRRFRKEGLDKAMGFQSACGDLGVLSGVMVAGLVGFALGWRVPLMLWGLLNLAGVAIGLAVSLGLPRLELSGPRNGTRDEAPLFYQFRQVVPDLLVFAIGGASFGICLTYLPLLAVDELDQATWVGSLLLSLWMGMGVFAALSYHRTLHRASRLRLLALAFLFNGLTAFLVGSSPWLESNLGLTTALTLLGLALVVGGLGLFVTYPVQFAIISTKTREEDHGTTFGMVFASQVMGSALLVFLTGQAADVTGSPATPFLVAGCLGLVAAVVSFKLIRSGNGES